MTMTMTMVNDNVEWQWKKLYRQAILISHTDAYEKQVKGITSHMRKMITWQRGLEAKTYVPQYILHTWIILTGCRTNSARCRYYPIQYWWITRFPIITHEYSLTMVVNLYANLFNTSSLDKINICRICFLNSRIEQLGSISFTMKFEIVAPQQKNIFILELCCGNLYKDAVIKISSYSRHGYLTLYRKNHQTVKHIIGMFIHEQCYIVVVKTFHGQNVLLYVYLMHTGSRWNISYITNHFVL